MTDSAYTASAGAPSGTAPKGTVDVDVTNADIYIYNSAWEKLAKNVAGTILVTSLAASGSEGQALINHSGVWTPSTDFSAQNLVTTGTLSVGATTAKTVLQPLVGTTTQPAIYMGGVTASATNYALTSNGTQTVVNGHSGAGIGVSLALDGTPVMQVQSANVLNFWSAVANPIFRQDGKTDDTLPQDLTIRSQAPFASATTQAKRTPGNLVYDIAAPVGDGLNGFHKFQVATNPIFTIGAHASVANTAAIYPGAVTPGTGNYAFAYGAATTASGGAGTDYVVLNGPGTVLTRTDNPGVGTSGAAIRVSINNLGVARFYYDGLFFATGTSGSSSTTTGYTIGQLTPLSDVPTVALSMFGQGAYASATGTNRNSGPVVIGTLAPVSGGTAGSVFLKPNATTAFEAAASGVITLPHYSTVGILHNDASGVVSSSLIAMGADVSGTLPIANGGTGQTSFAAGVIHSTGSALASSLIVDADVATAAAIAGSKVNPAFVAQNVSTTGTLSAGATTVTGLTDSGIGLGIVHSSAGGAFTSSLLVNADVSASAAIAYSKLALTGSIVSGDITSLVWSKITGTPTTLGGYGITDAVPSSRTLTGSGAIQIAGDNSAHDLSADRTISVLSATGSQLGVVKLANDLGGSATSPAVVNISGNGTLAQIRCSEFLWDAGVFPGLAQTISASGSGRLFSITAQSGQASGNTNGADVAIQGGDKHGTGLLGGVQLGLGNGNILAEVTEVATGKYVLALNHLTAVSTAATGSDPGSLTTYVGDCTSEPTTNPSSGVLLYSTVGTMKFLRSDGILVN